MTQIPEELETECAALLGIWRTRSRAAGGIVLKADFDPLDLPARILPSMFIYQREVHPDRTRFKCRLAGTTLSAAFGREATGQYLDDMMDPAFYPIRSRFFDIAATSQCPVYYRGTLALKDRDFIAFSRILLPARAKASDPETNILVGAMVFLMPGGVPEADLQKGKSHDGVMLAARLDGDTWIDI